MKISEKVLEQLKQNPHFKFPKAEFWINETSFKEKLSGFNDFEYQFSLFLTSVVEESYNLGRSVAWEEMRAQALAIEKMQEDRQMKNQETVAKAEAHYKQENHL